MPTIFANPIQNILQPLIDVFEWVLTTIHDNAGFSWGLSIVAMTIVIRALMLPLAVRQYRSMAAMQRLKPQIDELRKKHGKDKQRLNQEMMTFYQENKVNPFGSCLPLVLQMPVFVSLFYMLRTDLRHDICPGINPPGVPNPKPCGASEAASFLGIPDITDKAVGTTLIVLIVLYVASQLISSLLMSQATVDKNQRMIMLGLPFLFVPFVISFPAGLLVYWITTNFWTMGQQFTIKRTLVHRWHAKADAADAAAAAAGAAGIGAGNGGGGPGKGGGLFGSLVSRVQEANAAASAAAKGADDGGTTEKEAASPRAKSGGKAPAARTAPKRAGPPPSSPRKKKKRSGRRR